MCNRDHSHPSADQPAWGCRGITDAGRSGKSVTDLEFPIVLLPSPHVLELAGEEALRRLVRRQHVLLLVTPVGRHFPSDPEAFGRLVDTIADFVVEACGGSTGYTAARGATCMRTRHFPFSIDEAAREIWLEALFQAMVDTDFPEAVRPEVWNWLEPFSVRMINRRTTQVQPARIFYGLAQLRYGTPAGLPCGLRLRLCPHA